MEKYIDLFSRLLVATITFVVPIIINLLSTFTAGENRRKELSQDADEEISKRAAEEVQTNPGRIKETIDKSSQEYKANALKTEKELKLLNPVRQFWHIFSSLLLSFCTLSLDYLVRSNFWNLYNHKLSVILLILSSIGYLIGLFYIIRVLYTIKETKKMIEQKQ